jgi:hypothetical protein
MFIHPDRPGDDVSSAPESGTVRDSTSGNQPAHPDERMRKPGDITEGNQRRQCDKDDPSYAGEEP